MTQDAFTWRGVNFWAHIKNWYEVHSIEDNQQLLRDIRQQLSTLKNLIDNFRCNVLDEPGDRTIQAVNALESYYAWQKMLMDYEEKAVMALRGNLFESVIGVIRSGTDEII